MIDKKERKRIMSGKGSKGGKEEGKRVGEWTHLFMPFWIGSLGFHWVKWVCWNMSSLLMDVLLHELHTTEKEYCELKKGRHMHCVVRDSLICNSRDLHLENPGFKFQLSGLCCLEATCHCQLSL